MHLTACPVPLYTDNISGPFLSCWCLYCQFGGRATMPTNAMFAPFTGNIPVLNFKLKFISWYQYFIFSVFKKTLGEIWFSYPLSRKLVELSLLFLCRRNHPRQTGTQSWQFLHSKKKINHRIRSTTPDKPFLLSLLIPRRTCGTIHINILSIH